jgi:hypothetical protein
MEDRFEKLPVDATALAGAGIEAAKLLAEACRRAPEAGGAPGLEVVRDLSLELGEELSELVSRESAGPDLLLEAALRCAELANLAACAVPEMPAKAAPNAAAAAHLAGGATRALRAAVEASAPGLEDPRAGNLLRDARGAAWRAGLAARQVDELLEGRAKV